MNYRQSITFLCQCLAFWDSKLTAAAAETIDSGKTDWVRVLNYASRFNIAPTLFTALNNSGLLAGIPHDETEYLHTVWSLNRQRNRMMQQGLISVTNQLNAIGVTPLLLKGAIALLPDEYPSAFDRIMSDLDLLVPDGLVNKCSSALQKAGYEPVPFVDRDWESHSHDMPLIHPDYPVTIELHRDVLSSEVAKSKEIKKMAWQRSTTQQYEGACMAVPDITFRVLHNFAHSRLQHKRFANNQLDLRGLYEFVQLRQSWDAKIEYAALNHYLQDRAVIVPWQAYCLSAQQLFGQPPPCPVKAFSYAGCRNEIALFLAQSNLLLRATLLPKRLLTPSWYPAKLKALRHQWQQYKK